ncbi:MAG: hypothetical protein AAGF89_00205 [Bacteroidota bacterium]
MLRLLGVLFLLLIVNFSAFAQGIDHKFLASLWEVDRRACDCYDGVRKINYYLKKANIPDTLSYSPKGNRISYQYRQEEIKNPCGNDWSQEPVFVSRSNSHTFISYYAKLFTNSITKLENHEPPCFIKVEAFISKLYKTDKIKIANYSNEVLDDRYLELTGTGEVLVQGHYQQIDSTYLEFIPTPDPDTYEVINRVVQRKKYPKKVGDWIYRSPEGDTLRMERYPDKY